MSDPIFGILECDTCKTLYEPVCGDSVYCSRKCVPMDLEPKFHQHSFYDEVSLLITRTETNHCALCQTEVNNLCKFEVIFCSEYCHYNYVEDPEDQEDDWFEEEEEQAGDESYYSNEIPFAEWKRMNNHYASLTNAC